nr:hypothetical protein [Mycobacterium asiaticum]
MAVLSAVGSAQHIAGIADITLDEFDADPAQRLGFVRIANQRTRLPIVSA